MYWWLGFSALLLPPSPKSHAQVLTVPPVDWSVKLTVSGASPLVGLAEKSATGSAESSITVIDLVS